MIDNRAESCHVYPTPHLQDDDKLQLVSSFFLGKILEKSCFSNDPEFYEDFHAPIINEEDRK